MDITERTKPASFWRADGQLQLRYFLGQSVPEIAAALNCDLAWVEAKLKRPDRPTELQLIDLLMLFEGYDLRRNILEILDAKSGSTEQARLRASLLARVKIIQTRRDSNMQESNNALKTLDQLGAMSADELREHVASLVPGMEHKDRILRRGDCATDTIPVPRDGTTGADAAADTLA